MIINKDFYQCPKCKNFYNFDTAKPYTTVCPKCNCELEFLFNGDCNPERAEKVRKGIPTYDPTKDPESFFMSLLSPALLVLLQMSRRLVKRQEPFLLALGDLPAIKYTNPLNVRLVVTLGRKRS